MICAYCGEEFEEKNSLQRFCTKECQKQAVMEERRKPEPLEGDIDVGRKSDQRICVICGKLFTPNRRAPHQICCSKECSVVNNRKHADPRRYRKRKPWKKPGSSLEDIAALCRANGVTYGDYQVKETMILQELTGESVRARYERWKENQQTQKRGE